MPRESLKVPSYEKLLLYNSPITNIYLHYVYYMYKSVKKENSMIEHLYRKRGDADVKHDVYVSRINASI